jgi:hypothetical protein
MDEEEELTYKNRVWWFGLIITTFFIIAITVLVYDIRHGITEPPQRSIDPYLNDQK